VETSLRVIQFFGRDAARRVGLISDCGTLVYTLRGTKRMYDLACDALRDGVRIEEIINDRRSNETDTLDHILGEKRILIPFDHPDPYHHIITGTGLSHLGSASARDAMHSKISQTESSLTDSMKMFKWGVEGGKPPTGHLGAQPEWFYKGDGSCVVNPESSLSWPAYALDGGEEVEIVGIYLISPESEVFRIGFALANEYSDHVMERQNYLYLAHSKLRQCSYGPELLLGDLPNTVAGTAKLIRSNKTIWQDAWTSGDDNMCHSVTNLEQHHFKYRDFRRPGDVHIHFLGAATGSFTKQIATQEGDTFEISSDTFGAPLRNTLAQESSSPSLPIIIKNL